MGAHGAINGASCCQRPGETSRRHYFSAKQGGSGHHLHHRATFGPRAGEADRERQSRLRNSLTFNPARETWTTLQDTQRGTEEVTTLAIFERSDNIHRCLPEILIAMGGCVRTEQGWAGSAECRFFAPASVGGHDNGSVSWNRLRFSESKPRPDDLRS